MVRSSNMRSVTFLESICIALYAFGVLFTAAEACDGYTIKVNKLQPCDSPGPIKLMNPKIELTKDCFISTDGCVEVTKEFSSCKLIYDVKKRGMMVPFKGEKDICQELSKASKDPTVATNLKKYNVGPTCPVKENKICTPQGQKMDVSSHKSKFRLAAGQYTGTVTMDCNSGKSCYSFNVEFKRGK